VDLLPDGSRGPERVRRAGDYALTVDDPNPHFECGGPNGGMAFFGAHTRDGRLYEICDEQGNVVLPVTIESIVTDWKANAV
jgi:hypothetical protein